MSLQANDIKHVRKTGRMLRLKFTTNDAEFAKITNKNNIVTVTKMPCFCESFKIFNWKSTAIGNFFLVN